MQNDLSIDDEVPKRRLSVFNRTKTEGPVANYYDTDGYEEYYEKLKQESASWTRLLNEAKQKNAELKKKVKSTLVEKFDLETVDDEIKNVVLGQPDYCGFVEKVNELYNFAAIVAKQKKLVENMIEKKLQTLENKTDIELLELCNNEENDLNL